MLALAWANLMHSKVRTALSALAVGLGIMLLLVSKGLAGGSIAEVAERMQSVDAELVVLPAQDNIIFTNSAPFPRAVRRFIEKQADESGPLAAAVIPVFFGQIHMGGQQQRLFGVDPAQMSLFLGNRRVLDGHVFERAYDFARQLEDPATQFPSDDTPEQVLDAFLAPGLELVIDDRLRRVGRLDEQAGQHVPYRVGDEIRVMGREFCIVGVVETGVAGRVFAPLQTLREIALAGETKSSMFFVKLRPDVDPVAAADRLAATLGNAARVELKSEYGTLLRESFAQVNMYMNASSGLALVVCFLFILLTMYTVVIQHTREIGILKSLGVTRLDLMRLSVIEALIISLTGVVIGIGISFVAKWSLGIARPLLTVDLSTGLLILAILIGVVGGVLSALYPGYRAAQLDPAVALSHE
ncbi:MAG: ABC transporter permease [Planctomycetes bacterium]|nr:ABC transporter permease [Planctomycetota bacterium]